MDIFGVKINIKIYSNYLALQTAILYKMFVSFTVKKIMLPFLLTALFHLSLFIEKNNSMRFMITIYHTFKIAGGAASHG